jgi:hypothetical protein
MVTINRVTVALGIATMLLPLPTMLRAQELPQEARATPVSQVDPIQIGVVRSPAALQASATLLFLQPSGNMLFGTAVHPFPFPSPHWNNQSVDPGFSPAFSVGLRYDFDGGGDARLEWTHMNSYDHGSVRSRDPYKLGTLTGPPTIEALAPPFLIGPPLPFAFAEGVAHFAYDAVNLDAGVFLGTGGNVQLRTFAGVQVARISETLSGRFLSEVDAIAFVNQTRSVFTGAGPRMGAELHYIAGDLGLLGGIAGAAIIGSRQSSIDFVTASPANAVMGLTPNLQSMTSPSSTRIIPCIDTRLGASYAMSLGRGGLLRCEAGYQAAIYIDAINYYVLSEVENSMTQATEGIGSVYMRTVAEAQSNFMVHGPYLKLSLQF